MIKKHIFKKSTALLLVLAMVLSFIGPVSDLAFAQELGNYGDIALEHVKHLSQGLEEPRVAGTEHELAAANYIKGEFEDMDYEVEVHDFDYQGRGEDPETFNSQNIIAVKEGRVDQQVIIGAHYDQVISGGSQGAHDNASGVGAMLEVAERLKDVKTDYTIVFIAFGAEEVGLRGSRAYVEDMSQEEIDNTVAMINLDSIIAGDYAYVYAGSNGIGWARDKALAISDDLDLDLITQDGLHPDHEPGLTGDWSDHSAFNQAGIPIVYFESTNWLLQDEDGNYMDGYVETEEHGAIMHTERDNLDFIEENFPGRIEERFNTMTRVLERLLIEINPNEMEAKLTIVHVNDIHGRVSDDGESIIGYPRLKTMVNRFKIDNPNLLLLDAGDTLHGTNFANFTQGQTVVDLMDMVGFHAMVPGNHDFNYGSERLLEIAEESRFPVLGANIVDEDSGEAILDEYEIITMPNGLEVGIFGLSTEETKVKSHPNNTVGIDFSDPIEVAEDMVEALEDEDVDFIIALTHIGLDEESDPTTRDIAEEVDGIDLIVDGHSHSTLPEGLLVEDTLIVQASNHMENIGLVEIELSDIIDMNARLIDYEEAQDYDEDEEVLAFITEIEEENDEILSRVIGRTEVDLDGVRDNVRTRETNLGNLLTDAMLDLADADVALTNGGGIRESIEAGDITMSDILNVLPFDNYPAVIEVTGQDIVDALEFGTSDYPESAGKFPHVAGMTYEINILAEDGQRVENVMIAGQPIDLEETYDLVTNDFMAAGGDGYTMFEGSESVVDFSHLLLSDVLIDYIQEEEEINPIVEGRIVVTGRLNRESPVLYIEGYEDGTAKPNGEITREEVATIFNRLLTVDYLEMVLTSEHDFPDVESDRYSNDAIATLANAGVIQGYPDGTFKPGQSITRAEVVKMVSQFDRLNLVEGNDFKDSNGHWANHYINSAADKGWIIGYLDQTFRPNDSITRAEFATVINRMLDRDIDLEDLPNNPISFPDLNEGSWYYKDMMAAANGI